MVQLSPSPGPPSHRNAGGGQPARADEDGLARGVRRSGVVVGDPNGPSARRRWSGHRDVAAQADQHARSRGLGRGPGRPIGAQRLGGGAQVELDPLGDPHGRGRAVGPHQSPAGHRPHGDANGWAGGMDPGEVAVVAQHPQRGADRRIDPAVGERGRRAAPLRPLPGRGATRRSGGRSMRSPVPVPSPAGSGCRPGRWPRPRLRAHRGRRRPCRIGHHHGAGCPEGGKADRGERAGHDAPEETAPDPPLPATGGWLGGSNPLLS